MNRVGHPTITESKHATSALDTYFKFYQEVLEEEGELLRIYHEASEKRDAIMVDLDGTLCNLNHRLHHVKGEGKKDWGKFFRECGDDAVYEDVRSVMESEMQAGTEIVLCTGRPADYQEHTEKWLVRNEINYASLKMRPKLNYTRDDNVKAMLYRYEIKPYYNVKFVLDDRTQVVVKWRSMGLNCFQVRPGDF
jgi:hydroxymethylpyrimidine pyrophosphatase-like HAD family hydrolase